MDLVRYITAMIYCFIDKEQIKLNLSHPTQYSRYRNIFL